MKRVLMIASMASMLDNFNARNIELLDELGAEITLAANFQTEDSNSQERVQEFRSEMEKKGYRVVHIDFTRRLANLKGQISSFQQVKRLAEDDYAVVHCHSPICAAITRIVFRNNRKKGTRIIYTAHGFHFFKGAPKKNWLLYFPAEWLCSWWTDVLITINHEDYRRARRHLHAGSTEYIPGVGIDLGKFSCDGKKRKKRRAVREALGIPTDATVFFSVGELNANKNHSTAIKAFCKAAISDSYYFICGEGALKEQLLQLIKGLGLEERVKLLGFRKDIQELLLGADIFIFPSRREGLSVALMEAMASGVPCIVSKIRGNVDLLGENYEYLFQPDNVDELSELIQKMSINRAQYSAYVQKRVKKYSLSNVMKRMKLIYRRLIE